MNRCPPSAHTGPVATGPGLAPGATGIMALPPGSGPRREPGRTVSCALSGLLPGLLLNGGVGVKLQGLAVGRQEQQLLFSDR